LRLELDDIALPEAIRLPGPREIASIGLATESCAAEFAGLVATIGWEDLFMEHDDPAALGWQSATAGWQLEGDELRHGGGVPAAAIFKGPLLASYELVVNARLVGTTQPDGCYGLYPAARVGVPGPLLTVERGDGGWALVCHSGDARQTFPLPGFDPASYQQLRLRKHGARLAIQWEALPLGEIALADAPTQVGLYAHHAIAAFDLVRVTALP
jgi:hypothetical protein